MLPLHGRDARDARHEHPPRSCVARLAPNEAPGPTAHRKGGSRSSTSSCPTARRRPGSAVPRRGSRCPSRGARSGAGAAPLRCGWPGSPSTGARTRDRRRRRSCAPCASGHRRTAPQLLDQQGRGVFEGVGPVEPLEPQEEAPPARVPPTLAHATRMPNRHRAPSPLGTHCTRAPPARLLDLGPIGGVVTRPYSEMAGLGGRRSWDHHTLHPRSRARRLRLPRRCPARFVSSSRVGLPCHRGPVPERAHAGTAVTSTRSESRRAPLLNVRKRRGSFR
jgi:hypothetical protein